jgi:uncharacterized membrane protein YecN with MAPEG domain
MLDFIMSVWLSSDATFILGCIVMFTTVFHYLSMAHEYITQRVKDKSK